MPQSDYFEQEELFIGSGSSGEVPREFASGHVESAAIPLIEQKIYLIKALGALAEINEASEFIKAANSKVHQPRLKKQFGRNLGSVVAGEHKKKQRFEKIARGAFRHAFGTDQLLDIEFSEAEQLEDEAYQDFYSEYTGAENAKSRDDFMSRLQGDIVAIQTGFALKNRESQVKARETNLRDRLPEDLNTDERVEAILHDPRAGFLPATNQEKNMVLSYLDYLDNPEFPLGVPNQLFEAMRHTQKVTSSKAYPIRTLESIIYELGDFYADASKQRKSLADLQARLAGLRPNLPLADIDEISEDSLEMATITRYLDHIEALEHGEVEGRSLHQLLTTHTYRWAHGLDGGKHKTKKDRYTGEEVDADKNEFFTQRIQDRYNQMTVSQVYAILPHVIADQQLRGKFMKERLQEIAAEFATKRPLIKLAAIAEEQLTTTT